MTLSPQSLNSPPQRSGIDRDAASSYEVSWRRFRFLQWTTAQKPLINGTVCGSERRRRGRRLHLWVDAQLSSSYNRGCRQTGNKDMSEKTKSVRLNRLVLCYLIVGCGCRNKRPTNTQRCLTLLSSTRPSPGLPSSSSVSAAGLFRVSGSRRPKQAADRPLRQNTVKGMEVWRARCDTHRHTTGTFYCLNPSARVFTQWIFTHTDQKVQEWDQNINQEQIVWKDP